MFEFCFGGYQYPLRQRSTCHIVPQFYTSTRYLVQTIISQANIWIRCSLTCIRCFSSPLRSSVGKKKLAEICQYSLINSPPDVLADWCHCYISGLSHQINSVLSVCWQFWSDNDDRCKQMYKAVRGSYMGKHLQSEKISYGKVLYFFVCKI